jgi:hypothetical protein
MELVVEAVVAVAVPAELKDLITVPVEAVAILDCPVPELNNHRVLLQLEQIALITKALLVLVHTEMAMAVGLR